MFDVGINICVRKVLEHTRAGGKKEEFEKKYYKSSFNSFLKEGCWKSKEVWNILESNCSC